MIESVAYWNKRAKKTVDDCQAIGVPKEYDHYLDPRPILSQIRGQPMLDLGAGYGRYAIPIAKSGVEIYAVEPALGMVRRLKYNADVEGVGEQLHILRSDGRYLPFRESVFGSAICISTLHYLRIQDCRTVLREIKRTLNRGQILVTFRRFTMRGIKRMIVVGALRVLRGSDEIQEYMVTAYEAKRIVAQAGFGNVRLSARPSPLTVIATTKD